MLLLSQFYLTLPELQDVTSGADSQPSSGTLEPGQSVTEQMLTAPLFRHIHFFLFFFSFVSVCIAERINTCGICTMQWKRHALTNIKKRSSSQRQRGV